MFPISRLALHHCLNCGIFKKLFSLFVPSSILWLNLSTSYTERVLVITMHYNFVLATGFVGKDNNPEDATLIPGGNRVYII